MPRNDDLHRRLGGRIGPRVSVLVSKAMSDHLRRTAGFRTKLAAEGANEFFRGMSREKRQHASPFLANYLGAEGTPLELEALLRFIVYGEGELSELMGTLGLGNAVGTSIGAGIANALAPVNQKLIAADPNALLDPGTAAAADLRGINTGVNYAEDAAKGGMSNPRFGTLIRLAENFPGISELIELWRRGLISEGEVETALQRNAVATGYAPALLNLKREHLQPADAALATLRGILTESEGAAIAAISGIDGEDFATLVHNTGEPPGLMQLLEAFRRGFIDDSRLQVGIRQSRVRDEWIDVVEKLRFEPASAADAINGVIQGHLSRPDAEQIAQWNGLRPEDFNFLLENAGNPMANMQAIQLWQRGVISQQRVEEAIREGRTKDKYIPDILKLHVKLPGVFQVVRMLGTGSISQAEGSTLLTHEGYESQIIEQLVHASTSEQAVKSKALAQTQVEELYEELALTEAQATEHLKVLGLSGANAALALRTADIKRERKLIDAAITPIRTKYIGRHIDATEASTLMDKLKLPAAQRDYLLELWAIDRAANLQVLTPAQIIAANKLGLIKDTDTEARLIAHGYSLEDAQILMDSEKGRKVAAP